DVGRLHDVTVLVAGIAGRAVGGAIVALLAALDRAVAAGLDLAGRRAAVARDRVAVVALLAGLDDVVAAHRDGGTGGPGRVEASGGRGARIRGRGPHAGA